MIDEVLTVSPGSDRLPGRHRDRTRDGKRTREENVGIAARIATAGHLG